MPLLAHHIGLAPAASRSCAEMIVQVCDLARSLVAELESTLRPPSIFIFFPLCSIHIRSAPKLPFHINGKFEDLNQRFDFLILSIGSSC